MVTIPKSMPDSSVPCERIGIDQEPKQKSLFLKGPIPLSWVRKSIPDPTSRLLLVLRAYSDMQRAEWFKVSKEIEREAGLKYRKAVHRALKQLEDAGAVKVIRKPGRRPTVKVNAAP